MKLNLAPLVTTAASYTSPVIPTDTRLDATFAFNVKISATASVQIQYTLDDVYSTSFVQGSATWTNFGAAVTTSGVVQQTGFGVVGATGFQAVVTGNTGTVTIQGWQNVTSIT